MVHPETLLPMPENDDPLECFVSAVSSGPATFLYLQTTVVIWHLINGAGFVRCCTIDFCYDADIIRGESPEETRVQYLKLS
ncbi:hypothetical protein BJX76DRAFT_316053 [Aspergillus varians]